MTTNKMTFKKRRSRLSSSQYESVLGFSLFLPALLVVTVIIVKPLVESLWLSLHKRNLLSMNPDPTFVGLDNYVWMFQSDWFWGILATTLLITVVVVNLQLWFAIGLAVLLDFDFPGQGIVRTLLITPWAIPVVVTAFMWRWMYDPSFGPLNYWLRSAGLIDQPIAWLGLKATALPAVMGVLLWKGLPFMLLAMIAGLQQVPNEMREAARVDGANPWQEFWHIVLPSMRQIILLMVILRSIFLFNHFDLIYLLTGGGPADATRVLSIQAVNLGFDSFRFGRAAAITSFMFLVLVVVSVVYFRIARMNEAKA